MKPKARKLLYPWLFSRYGLSFAPRFKSISVTPLLLSIFLVLPAETQAQFTYVTNEDDTITIKGYTGPGGNVTIPSIITGRSVTAIDQNAFYEYASLTGITIPNTLITIYPQAFLRCTGLTNVNLGNGVMDIGGDAFGGCSNLTRMVIPASTTDVDVHAFGGCTHLAEINVALLNSVYHSLDGVLFDKSQTTLVLYPEGKLVSNYTVPNGVTNIGPHAFLGCANLTGVTLPETLTSLGEWAFGWCNNLTRVTLPNSLTNIQDGHVSIGGVLGIFSYCTSLTNVILGKNLAYLGMGTFWGCTNLMTSYFQGNKPETAVANLMGWPWIFEGDTSVIVYYLPGTTGWGPTYSGRPTMLWNPQVQTDSVGVGANGFGFNITGTPDIPIVIEATTSLTAQSWAGLQNCTLTNGLVHFSDPQWASYSGRFYRIRSP